MSDIVQKSKEMKPSLCWKDIFLSLTKANEKFMQHISCLKGTESNSKLKQKRFCILENYAWVAIPKQTSKHESFDSLF